MQLKPHRGSVAGWRSRLGAAPVVLGLLAAAPARAGVEAASRITVFQETSSGARDTSVTVLHPQTDVSANLGEALSISAGYQMDIVTGATPRIQGVDAVSSATRFEDLRQTAGGGLGWNLGEVSLNAGYSHGWEKDYRSNTVQVGGRGDFLERNLTLGLNYTRNIDEVCDANNATAQGPLELRALAASDHCFQPGRADTVTRRVDIHTFEPTLAWTATPKLLVQVGGTLQVLDGFQSNPYRRVRVGQQGAAPQEHLPRHRQRYAAFSRAHFAIPSLRAALLLGVRGYRDTWDLWAASFDLGLRKYLADALILALDGRYHLQTGAIFYRSARDYVNKGPAGAYWTGDRELSPMGTVSGGLKLAYLKRRGQELDGFFDEVEFSIRFDGMFYQLEEGAPNFDRKLALIGALGAALRF